jgi:hypothetical protein
VYPDISGETIGAILAGGTVVALAGYAMILLLRARKGRHEAFGFESNAQLRHLRDTWRMPPLDQLERPRLTLSSRIWMTALRGYLVIAVGLVVVKVVQMMLMK